MTMIRPRSDVVYGISRGLPSGMYACMVSYRPIRVCIMISALFLNRAFKNNIILYNREDNSIGCFQRN